MATNEPNKADNVINIDPGKRATEEKAAPDQPLQAGGEAPAPDKTAPAPEEKAPAKKAVRRGRPPKAEQEAKKPRKPRTPRTPKEKAAGIPPIRLSVLLIRELYVLLLVPSFDYTRSIRPLSWDVACLGTCRTGDILTLMAVAPGGRP